MPYKDPTLHREEARERYAIWKSRHPGVAEARARAYYEQNREVVLEAQRAYRADPSVRANIAQYMAEYKGVHKLPPIPDYWPYNMQGWPIDTVNAIVPREITDPIRADICQELCLLLVEGVGEADIKGYTKDAQRRNGYTYGYRVEDLMSTGWDIPVEVWV